MAWNLAGLVGHLPTTEGIPAGYPGYPAPHHASPHYSPHLLGQPLPPDLAHSYSPVQYSGAGRCSCRAGAPHYRLF